MCTVKLSFSILMSDDLYKELGPTFAGGAPVKLVIPKQDILDMKGIEQYSMEVTFQPGFAHTTHQTIEYEAVPIITSHYEKREG